MTYKIPNAQTLNGISHKFFQISRPVHVIFKSDKLDYLRCPRKEIFLIIFLASNKVLAMLGSLKTPQTVLPQTQTKHSAPECKQIDDSTIISKLQLLPQELDGQVQNMSLNPGKDFYQVQEPFKKLLICEFSTVLADRAIWAALKISAILLKYSTFECVFFMFSSAKKHKITVWLCTLQSPLYKSHNNIKVRKRY